MKLIYIYVEKGPLACAQTTSKIPIPFAISRYPALCFIFISTLINHYNHPLFRLVKQWIILTSYTFPKQVFPENASPSVSFPVLTALNALIFFLIFLLYLLILSAVL